MSSDMLKGVLAASVVEADEIEVKKIVLLPSIVSIDDARKEEPPNVKIAGIMNIKNYDPESTVLDPTCNVLLNFTSNVTTGGSWDIQTKRDTTRTIPNSRGQTWQQGDFVSALPTYKTYVETGSRNGNRLTLGRGEYLGNVNIANISLDQIVDSEANANMFFTFSKSGGGTDENAIVETYTMNMGNLFLHASENTTLKKRNGNFEFSNTSLLEFSDMPNDFSKGHVLQVNDSANCIEYGIKIETNDERKSLAVGSNLGPLHENYIGIGFDQHSQALSSDTVLIGNSTGQSITGTKNVIVGHDAFSSDVLSECVNNTCVGNQAMKGVRSSNRNVAIGKGAGKNSTSNGSIWLGNNMGNNCNIDNQLIIGNSEDNPLLEGIMGNSNAESVCNINAKYMYLCSNSNFQSNTHVLPYQIWNDTESGGILKMGNVGIGSSSDVVGGDIDEDGNLLLHTRDLNTANIHVSGSTYTGACLSANITNTQINIVRRNMNTMTVPGILSTDYQISTNSEITDDGNMLIKTAGGVNDISIPDVYKGVVTGHTLGDTTLSLHTKNDVDIDIGNVLHEKYQINNQSFLTSNGNIVFVTNGGSVSNVTSTSSVYKGNLVGGAMVDTTLTMNRFDDSNLVVSNVLSVDYTYTAARVLEDGNIELVTQNNQTSNVIVSGNVYKGNVVSGVVEDSNIVLTRNGTGNITISDIYNRDHTIVSGCLEVIGTTSTANLSLVTRGVECANMVVSGGYINTNDLNNVWLSQNKLYFEQKLDGETYISSVQLGSEKVKIPSHLKRKIDPNGLSSRYYQLSTVTSPEFTSSSMPNFVVNGNLNDTTNYGLFAGTVQFEFPSMYAINELQMVLFDTTNFVDNEILTGKVEVFGSKDNSTWVPLNICSGYYLDASKVNIFGNGDEVVSLPLYINVDEYKHYKVSFTGFTPSTSPKIKEINFEYIGIYELTNTSTVAVPSTAMLVYVFPTMLQPLVSTANLPEPYLFIKDKPCGVRCTFTGGHDFHSSIYSELIHSFEYSTDNIQFIPFIIDASSISIQVINKTIDFIHTSANAGTTYFNIVLKDGTVTSQTYSFSTDIYEFPSLTSTTIGDSLVPVGDTLTFTSVFSSSFPTGVTGTVQITPVGQTTEAISGVSISGTDISYSMVMQYDVEHASLITLSMSNFDATYTWAGEVLGAGNIFTYPTLTSASSLPSTKYTVGVSNISRTFTFGSLIDDFEITGTFQNADESHTGIVEFSKDGFNGTIFFLPTSNATYTISNFQLKHVSDDKLMNIPSSHNFTIANSQFWVPPSNISSTTTITSLPSPFVLVVNKITRLRLTFDGTYNFHSSSYLSLVTSIEFSTNSGSSYTSMDLSSANLSIHGSNKTIDLNFTASSILDHLFRVVLKGEDGVSTSHYTTSILSNKIFSFPSILSTVKLPPYDTTDITIGQTISMESNFDSTIPVNIVASISMSEAGSTPVALSTSISGSKYSYSFVVNNDNDHSATITFGFGGVNNTYTWSATGILTAADDIYTFPNLVSYNGSINGYGSGIHLKTDNPGILVLSFEGGDKLHSNTYGSQIASITYKTGVSGPDVAVQQSDAVIDSTNETITLSNVMPTDVQDIYFTVTLIAPDGVQAPLAFTIPNTSIVANYTVGGWLWPQNNTTFPGSSSSAVLYKLNGPAGIGYNNGAWYTFHNTHLDNDFYFVSGNGHDFHAHDIFNAPNYHPLKPYGNISSLGYAGRSWQRFNESHLSANGQYYMEGDIAGFGGATDARNYLSTGWRFSPGNGNTEVGGTSTFVVGWGFNSAATVTRVYCDIEAYSPPGTNSQWQMIGYASANDYYNETNGTVMEDVTGYTWMSNYSNRHWHTLTTPGTVSHIKLKKVNGPRFAYSINIMWGQ